MSSILSGTTPVFEDTNADGGLDIVGNQDQSNLFFLEGNGNDVIAGGLQFDSIEGGEGNDRIRGLDGDDELIGGLGDDTIFGGNNQDFLDGGAGNDILKGGAGDDILIGGTGVDEMTGGSGDDVFEFAAEDLFDGNIDKITDFSESDEFGDIIRLKGIASDAMVEYDSETGLISVDGEDIIQVDQGLDITIDNQDGDDIWELF